jgi:hypothetical protein
LTGAWDAARPIGDGLAPSGSVLDVGHRLANQKVSTGASRRLTLLGPKSNQCHERKRLRKNMALFKRGDTWRHEFLFARRRVRESAKTTLKTVRSGLNRIAAGNWELGFNGLADVWEAQGQSVKEIGWKG